MKYLHYLGIQMLNRN